VVEVFRRFLAAAFGLRLARIVRALPIAINGISSTFSTSGGMSAVASALDHRAVA
jgi:hypothetical protein